MRAHARFCFFAWWIEALKGIIAGNWIQKENNKSQVLKATIKGKSVFDALTVVGFHYDDPGAVGRKIWWQQVV